MSFNILSHLEITDNRADQPDPVIIFRKTELTNPLANFRTGDIAVLYPAFDESDNALHHQVIKCTITVLERDYVTVQLRYRQFNLKPFDTEGYWNLEPDLMDIGFASMYRGLFEWAGSSPNKRRLLLGQDAPRQNPEIPNPTTSPNSVRSREIFKQIVRSKDDLPALGPARHGQNQRHAPRPGRLDPA